MVVSWQELNAWFELKFPLGIRAQPDGYNKLAPG